MSKSILFLVKSFLDNFYRHLAIFSGHTGTFLSIVTVGKIAYYMVEQKNFDCNILMNKLTYKIQKGEAIDIDHRLM